MTINKILQKNKSLNYNLRKYKIKFNIGVDKRLQKLIICF